MKTSIKEVVLYEIKFADIIIVTNRIEITFLFFNLLPKYRHEKMANRSNVSPTSCGNKPYLLFRDWVKYIIMAMITKIFLFLKKNLKIEIKRNMIGNDNNGIVGNDS